MKMKIKIKIKTNIKIITLMERKLFKMLIKEVGRNNY